MTDEELIKEIQEKGLKFQCTSGDQYAITYPEALSILMLIRQHDEVIKHERV